MSEDKEGAGHHVEMTIAESMILHIGTKLVKRSAEAMTKKAYCDYRGWKLPDDEDGSELVYLVEYEPDERNKPNHQDHKGYISMSPVYVFDESYKIAESYLDRLKIEGDELMIKVTKLNKALADKEVPESEVDILQAQLAIMTGYLNILSIRLKKAQDGGKK